MGRFLLPFRNIRLNKMPFKKFVSIGSVAVLQDGPCKGKIAAIVDVIDQNRVLIDGPCSEVPRQEYPIKNLHLTALKAKFPFSAWSRRRGSRRTSPGSGRRPRGPSGWRPPRRGAP